MSAVVHVTIRQLRALPILIVVELGFHGEVLHYQKCMRVIA